MNTNRLDCLCAGTIVADVRVTEAAAEYHGASLDFMDTAPRYAPGGVAIVASRLAAMNRSVAVAGCIGRDLLGWGLKHAIESCSIQSDLVREVDHATSFSYIRLNGQERRIQHYIGANALIGGQGRLCESIKTKQPRFFLLGYLGLLPDMEGDNAHRISEALSAAHAVGSTTIVDIHTCRHVQALLPSVLPGTDLFFCNQEEAIMLSGGKTSEKSLLESLWRIAGPAVRRRIFGITRAERVSILWNNRLDCDPEYAEVPNPVLKTTGVHDVTGAGDSFRAGVIDYLLSSETYGHREYIIGAMIAGHRSASHAISR